MMISDRMPTNGRDYVVEFAVYNITYRVLYIYRCVSCAIAGMNRVASFFYALYLLYCYVISRPALNRVVL